MSLLVLFSAPEKRTDWRFGGYPSNKHGAKLQNGLYDFSFRCKKKVKQPDSSGFLLIRSPLLKHITDTDIDMKLP